MKEIDETTRIKTAQHVTWIGFFVNLALTAFKLFAGIWGKSSAMIADAIHSLSDFITDIIVITFIRISNKGKDESHDYGHGKFETFATMLIGVALIAVAIGIFYSGLKKCILAIHGTVLPQPSMIALIAALISIVSKEILFRYTKKKGVLIKSPSVIANAWHHRSDALSSIGTFLGIGGAIFFGEKWRILDPIAAIIVSCLIMVVATKISKDAIAELLDSSLPQEVENEINNLISNINGIKFIHNLKTRKNGNNYIIDVHIKVDKDMTVENSHQIATEVEQTLKDKYGRNTYTTVHVEPYYPDRPYNNTPNNKKLLFDN